MNVISNQAKVIEGEGGSAVSYLSNIVNVNYLQMKKYRMKTCCKNCCGNQSYLVTGFCEINNNNECVNQTNFSNSNCFCVQNSYPLILDNNCNLERQILLKNNKCYNNKNN